MFPFCFIFLFFYSCCLTNNCRITCVSMRLFQKNSYFNTSFSLFLLFFFFYSCSNVMAMKSLWLRSCTVHRTAGERGVYFFKSSPPLPPASSTSTSSTFRYQPDDSHLTFGIVKKCYRSYELQITLVYSQFSFKVP